jgi:hypothetical protein
VRRSALTKSNFFGSGSDAAGSRQYHDAGDDAASGWANVRSQELRPHAAGYPTKGLVNRQCFVHDIALMLPEPR